MSFPYRIKNELKLFVGFGIVAMGVLFIVNGNTVLEVSETFKENQLIERLPEEKEDIDYHDHADQVEWLIDFDIDQTDSDPPIIGYKLGLHGYVQTRETPQELALHIFHEDAFVYFTGDEDYHYKAITKNLDKVPSLKYGDIYHIEMDMEGLHVGNESTVVNGDAHIEFKKPGTYYAHVSVKLPNGEIVYYPSNTSIFTISDGKQEWMIDALDTIIQTEETNKPFMISTFGWAVVAIGIGLIISGLSLIIGGTEKRRSLLEKIRGDD